MYYISALRSCTGECTQHALIWLLVGIYVLYICPTFMYLRVHAACPYLVISRYICIIYLPYVHVLESACDMPLFGY